MLPFCALVVGDAGDTPSVTLVRAIDGFSRPSGIDILPNGDLVVTEKGRIQRVSPEGEFEVAVGKGKTFEDAVPLVAHGEDEIIVGFQSQRGLRKIGISNGTILQEVGGRKEPDEEWKIDSAIGMAMGKRRVYVSDVTRYRVTTYDTDSLQRKGQLSQRGVLDVHSLNRAWRHGSSCEHKTFTLHSPYKGPSCFNPHGLAWTPGHGGRLFVADPDNHAIHVFNRDYEWVKAIDRKKMPQLDTPRGLAVDPSGRLLYVAGRKEIHILSAQGRHLSTTRVPGAQNMLNLVVGAAPSPRTRGPRLYEVGSPRLHIYAADPTANKVFVLATEGATAITGKVGYSHKREL